MEREKLESLLIDYIDNKLNSVDRIQVEKELVNNAEAYRLYEELKEVMQLMDRSARLDPSGALKENFIEMLGKESAAQRSAKVVAFKPAFYRVAAAVALLVIGGSVGYLISQQNDKRLADIEEKVRIQDEQIRLNNQMMAMLGNDESASQRIQGVNVAMSREKADDEVVKALVKLMNEDPNSNVRLAALEALSKFIAESAVRKHIINSLPQQKDPVVQIALIQLLVKIREKGVVDDLQDIVNDEGTMKAVKDEAYTGILKLS